MARSRDLWGARSNVLFALLLAGCADLVPVPKAPPLLPPDNLPNVPSEPDPVPQTPADDDPVTLTAVEPTEGPVTGLVDVMVRGTGFRAGLEILFGESPALDVFVITPTVAMALTPPRPAGRVDVTVLHPRATGEPSILPTSYRYFDTIAVDLVDPAEGVIDGGERVAVYGRGFTPDTRVFFDGRPALSQEFIDTSLIRGVSPPGRFGRIDVQAVGFNGAAALSDGFLYLQPPELVSSTPAVGIGGTRVTLSGTGLGDDSEVAFGGAMAEVVAISANGRTLDVIAPTGAGLVDITVSTRAGVTTLPHAFAYRQATDPMILACSHLVPARGPQSGGTRVELACGGLAYGDIRVLFGASVAEIIEIDEVGGRVVVHAPAGTGEAAVTVRNAVAGPVAAGRFTWDAPPALAVTTLTPTSGPSTGGTRLTLHGRGFTAGMSVTVGALAALHVEVVDSTQALITTPPGAPGLADVTVRASGTIARLPDAFDYTSDRVRLSLIAPATAARSGGTWLRVFGEGFTPSTRVIIGGVVCTPIAFISSAELHVRSPRVPVGVWDAEVRDMGDEAQGDPALGPTSPRRDVRERLFTSFDPRSGTGGTWGPPVGGNSIGTLNVTVWGSGGYGAVEGAFVLVGSDPDGPWRGFTDDEGQVTLSGPGLTGPIEVTASRDGFTAYSVLRFDAQNVTVLLQQNPVPPPTSGGGGGNPPTIPPNATLRGRVTGLDKYVIAPPGSCAAVAIPETRHCAPCDAHATENACSDEAFACVDMAAPGSGLVDSRCVATCSDTAPCPDGYVCGATSAGARCLPSPGIRRAYCNVSSTSLFGYEYPIPARGWVDENATFELDSRRLGDLAIYCFGGYQAQGGAFVPTVMGVRRHIITTAGALMENLDVALDIPLSRAFRFRLQEPPIWSTGLLPPNVIISLDLGADGVIPFSRALVRVDAGANGGEPIWVASNQLTALSGPLYDVNYFLYSTLAPANTAGFQPRSYNMIQHVRSLAEDRFPVRDDAGWRLEGSQVGFDLFSAFLADDDEGTRLWAAGEKGQILLHRAVGGWNAQTSGTTRDLYGIHGTHGRDVWAVGDAGTVRHWDGIAWGPIDAPFDDYGAVHVTADHVFLAGRVRTRTLDRHSGTWSILGGPILQEVRAFIPTEAGLLLSATGGRLFLVDGSLTVTPVSSPTTKTLRAGLVTTSGDLVLVGDGGTIVAGAANATGLITHTSPTTSDLTALTELDGALVIVGDNGVAMRGPDPGNLSLETITDYRSRAHAVVAMPDQTVRVVGSAAFILGPFLHFPIVTAPVHELALTDLTFSWTFTGPASQYTRLALTPDGSITLWTMIVDGAKRTAVLPDLQAAAGLAPLPRGRYRLEVLRVLNRTFDIDNFTTRDFGLYMRDSWATNEAWFVLP